ncbi:SpoIIE family protein phosphatase [Streptomyces cavernae]|uniref:SpoIIE family protein phosphatase n=1 Tax=Streptomyces cavernae TaxID=2259034 RepID=UPI000FEC146C|nr:SpoIIE family protein phosphatase [Streptomyces cavernae]
MTGAQSTDPVAGGAGGTARQSLVTTLGELGTAAYVVDEQGCIIAVNARAERLLARPARDFLGRDAHDLLHRGPHGEVLPRMRCTMRTAFLSRRTAQARQDWFERGDGSLLPVSWLLTPYDLGDDQAGTLVLFHTGADEAPGLGTAPERAAGPLPELERLALLAETTTQLTSTLVVEEALRRLVALVVPRLADWAVIDLITERGEVWRTAVVHEEDGSLVTHEDLQGPLPPVPEDSPMPLSRALRGVASSTLADSRTYQDPPDSGIAFEQHRLFEATGIHSAAIAPVRSPREVLGALTLGRSERPERFAASDLALLEDIARRAGLALDNARLYQRQRKVAETMQRHLLPQLPHVPPLRLTARYLPAPDASQVGGDWYDAFPLTDGATALVIGDVVGHDLDAAAGMAQLRNMLRAYAWSQQEPPSRIVERLDQAVTHITDVPMATMLMTRVTMDDNHNCELFWTNAGHPPPLLVTREGLARYLTDGHGILLGAGSHQPRPDATVALPPGSTLVLYTDGLIETPSRSLDHGMDRLRRHAAALAHRPLDSFTDDLLSRTRPTDNDDDVALLTLRTPT